MQEGPCSVHAEAAFAGGLQRICCVNVKLTVGLAGAAGLIVCFALYTSPVLLQVAGEAVLQAVSNKVWSSRDEGVEGCPYPWCGKTGTDGEGLLRAFPR